MDIYQRLWDADQRGNGIRAIKNGSNDGDASHGYVEVHESVAADTEHQVIKDPLIPERKRASYDLCDDLFNNYVLDQTKADPELQTEIAEIDDFLDLALDTEVMEVARLYAESQTGESYSRGRWHAVIRELWFGRFSQRSGPDLSGFEHVFVGEQKGGKLGGYHFWYKYWIDDSNHLLPHGEADEHAMSDHVQFLGLAYRGTNSHEGKLVPEVVTLSHKLKAFDYASRANRPLTKPIGGFFVGCSAEGLMAIGAVRALRELRAPKDAVINRARFELKVYRSQNNRHIRTFYPVFLDLLETDPRSEHETVVPSVESVGLVGATTTVTNLRVGSVRVIAALVNPEGHDPGFETVVLINTVNEPIDLNGWTIADKHGKSESINGVLNGYQTGRVKLTGHGAQLSNKGGTITLIDPTGKDIHSVSYTKNQAKKEGRLVVF